MTSKTRQALAALTLATTMLSTAPGMAAMSTNGWQNGSMNGWTNGWSNGWANGWNNGSMNGWNNGANNGSMNRPGTGDQSGSYGDAVRVIGIELPR